MITKVFTVYDSKATCYGVPFFMPTVGAAIRAFTDLTNDPNSMVYRHAGDFVLYQIGEFNDQTSELDWISPAVHLGIASEFLAVKRPAVPPALDDYMKRVVENPTSTVAELANGGTK